MHVETRQNLNDTRGTMRLSIEGQEVLAITLEALQRNHPTYQESLHDTLRDALLNAYLLGYKNCKTKAVLTFTHL